MTDRGAWRVEAKAEVDRAAARMKEEIDKYVENGYVYAQGEIDLWLCTNNGWRHKLYVSMYTHLTNPKVKRIGQRIKSALGFA